MFTLKTWNSVTKRPKKGENTCQGLNGRFQKLILKESGEGVGGEAEKGGPGLQNGPPQPGPGQGGQGLCALKCAITSRQTAQCSFYINVQFHFQNKWDPVIYQRMTVFK